jgi:Winged helix DNA-binding domain
LPGVCRLAGGFGAIATRADAAADPGFPTAGRRARGAYAARLGVAAAGGVGRLAGQHAESRAALAARAGRRRRVVDVGGSLARPALGTSLQHLCRPQARLRVVLAGEASRGCQGSPAGRAHVRPVAHAHLGGARRTDREVGRALGVGNSLRYAAPTGTVAIRWDGARAPEVWTVPPPEIDPADACRELARRYLHVFGPTTADGFARWAGISRRSAAAAFASLGLRDQLA